MIYGGKRLDRPGFFVEPALVKARPEMPIVGEETFAPILYVMSYRTIDEAIAIQNAVEQGLTVFMVTHDLASLTTVCDRVAALADGRIVAIGPMRELLQSEHPWVRAYFHGARAKMLHLEAN